MPLPLILNLSQSSDLSRFKCAKPKDVLERLAPSISSITSDLSVNSIDAKAHLNAKLRRLSKNIPLEKSLIEAIKAETDKISPGTSTKEEIEDCIASIQKLWQVRRAG